MSTKFAVLIISDIVISWVIAEIIRYTLFAGAFATGSSMPEILRTVIFVIFAFGGINGIVMSSG